MTIAISQSWHLVLCTTSTVGNALVSDILGLPAPNFFCNIVFVLPGIRGPTLLQMYNLSIHVWSKTPSTFVSVIIGVSALTFFCNIAMKSLMQRVLDPKTGSCRHCKRGDVLDQSYTYLSWTLL